MLNVSRQLEKDLEAAPVEKPAETNGTWTAYYIEQSFVGKCHVVTLTNDDNMDGKPDGRIAIVQLFGDDPKSFFAVFGKTSRVEKGREISVYMNGVKQ